MKAQTLFHGIVRAVLWTLALLAAIAAGIGLILVLTDDEMLDGLIWVCKVVFMVISGFGILWIVLMPESKPRSVRFAPDHQPTPRSSFRHPTPAWDRKPIVTPPAEAEWEDPPT